MGLACVIHRAIVGINRHLLNLPYKELIVLLTLGTQTTVADVLVTRRDVGMSGITETSIQSSDPFK